MEGKVSNENRLPRRVRDPFAEAALAKVWRGDSEFGPEVESSPAWDRLAAYVFGHYKTKLPPFISRDDIRQEVLIEAFLRAGGSEEKAFDPKTAKLTKKEQQSPDKVAAALFKYAAWNGCDKAKKFVNRARNSKRRDGKAPSRHELAISGLARGDETPEDVEGRVYEKIATEADQLDRIERMEVALELATVADGPEEEHVARALVAARGDRALAAVLLWEDLEARFELRVSNEDEAEAALDERLIDMIGRVYEIRVEE